MREERSEEERPLLNKHDAQLLRNQDKSIFCCSRTGWMLTICIFLIANWRLESYLAARKEPAAMVETGMTRSKSQTSYISDQTPFVFIHVGKCGGATIRAELNRAGYN